MGWPYDEDEGLRDRVVTLTVGQLTDALAEALKVVSDVEPRWKRGDRAYVEVEVTGKHGGGKHVNLQIVGAKSNVAIPANLLKEIA